MQYQKIYNTVVKTDKKIQAGHTNQILHVNCLRISHPL